MPRTALGAFPGASTFESARSTMEAGGRGFGCKRVLTPSGTLKRRRDSGLDTNATNTTKRLRATQGDRSDWAPHGRNLEPRQLADGRGRWWNGGNGWD